MGVTEKKFGERIRELRVSINLSQEELAYRASVHRTYLGSIERGERHMSRYAMPLPGTLVGLRILSSTGFFKVRMKMPLTFKGIVM
ncbi:helix-turn-helix domain-containing protein [Chloroflexota bacterium]